MGNEEDKTLKLMAEICSDLEDTLIAHSKLGASQGAIGSALFTCFLGHSANIELSMSELKSILNKAPLVYEGMQSLVKAHKEENDGK